MITNDGKYIRIDVGTVVSIPDKLTVLISSIVGKQELSLEVNKQDFTDQYNGKIKDVPFGSLTGKGSDTYFRDDIYQVTLTGHYNTGNTDTVFRVYFCVALSDIGSSYAKQIIRTPHNLGRAELVELSDLTTQFDALKVYADDLPEELVDATINRINYLKMKLW